MMGHIFATKQDVHTYEREHSSTDLPNLAERCRCVCIAEYLQECDVTLSPKFNKPTERPPSTTVKCSHDRNAIEREESVNFHSCEAEKNK
jgi:hypothetical protein